MWFSVYVTLGFNVFLLIVALILSPRFTYHPFILNAIEHGTSVDIARRDARIFQVMLILFAALMTVIPYDMLLAMGP